MSLRPWSLCLCAVAACGRLGFDTIGVRGGDGGGSNTDAANTGSAGPRYLIELDANATAPAIAGKQARVAVLEQFQGAITVAGTALAGQAMYSSSGVVWLDPAGVASTSTVLDSTSVCQIRTLGNAVAGDGVLAAGYSQSGTTTPAYGPCAIATGTRTESRSRSMQLRASRSSRMSCRSRSTSRPGSRPATPTAASR